MCFPELFGARFVLHRDRGLASCRPERQLGFHFPATIRRSTCFYAMWAGGASAVRCGPVRATQNQTRGFPMFFRSQIVSIVVLPVFFSFSSRIAAAQAPTPVCQPAVTSPITVASPAQRLA